MHFSKKKIAICTLFSPRRIPVLDHALLPRVLFLGGTPIASRFPRISQGPPAAWRRCCSILLPTPQFALHGNYGGESTVCTIRFATVLPPALICASVAVATPPNNTQLVAAPYATLVIYLIDRILFFAVQLADYTNRFVVSNKRKIIPYPPALAQFRNPQK